VSSLDPSSRTKTALHPDDREEPDESGPWLPILVGAALVWIPLAVADWRLLADGTLLWATVKSTYTLVLAPLAAAALLQDTRALGTDGVEVGWPKWLYALVAVGFPPVAGVYLLHRRLLCRS
jgi:hypothetical protein